MCQAGKAKAKESQAFAESKRLGQRALRLSGYRGSLEGSRIFFGSPRCGYMYIFILGYTGEWKVKWNLQYWLGLGFRVSRRSKRLGFSDSGSSKKGLGYRPSLSSLSPCWLFFGPLQTPISTSFPISFPLDGSMLG